MEIRGKKQYKSHITDEFFNEGSHINGIESFLSFAKRRLQKFNGIDRNGFDLPEGI